VCLNISFRTNPRSFARFALYSIKGFKTRKFLALALSGNFLLSLGEEWLTFYMGCNEKGSLVQATQKIYSLVVRRSLSVVEGLARHHGDILAESDIEVFVFSAQ